MMPLLILVLEQSILLGLVELKKFKNQKSLGLLAVFDESAVVDQ
jgi:hypothetical protein